MSDRLFLKDVRLVGREGAWDLDLEGGTIRALRPTGELSPGGRLLEGEGRLLLPGIIDVHVHFREPGFPHKGDLESESRAAVAGGVTSFLDMPNTKPPTLTREDLQAKKERAAGRCHANYGFHMGTTGKNLDELRAVEGIPSIKIYMNETTGGLTVQDPDLLRPIFSLGIPLSLHAEEEMMALALELFEECQPPLVYFCHVSTRTELALLEDRRDARIVAEVTPHHLTLTDTDWSERGDRLRVKPVLKTAADRDALWEALRAGHPLQTIGSDHAPHTIAEKDGPNPPYGLPGVDLMLPWALEAVHAGRWSLDRLVMAMAEVPARTFGMTGKGVVREGADADLVLVDLDRARTVDQDVIQTRPGWSPYEGMTFRGWPTMTIVGGRIAWDETEGFRKPGGAELRFD